MKNASTALFLFSIALFFSFILILYYVPLCKILNIMSGTPVLIYAESTPNPATLKFVANVFLLPEKSAEYLKAEDAEGAPLVQALFEMPFVRAVYVCNNFVTITKKEFTSWTEIIPQVREFLKSWLTEGKDVIVMLPTKKEEKKPVEIADLNSEGIAAQIIDALDEYVKPAVESDGGEISFVSFNNGVVTVRLQGSCSGCPSSTVTLKQGIENLLKRMVPGVTEVIAENG